MTALSVIALVTKTGIVAICAKEMETDNPLGFLAENYSNADSVRQLLAKGHLNFLRTTSEESEPASAKPAVIQCRIEDLGNRIFGRPDAIYIYNDTSGDIPTDLKARWGKYERGDHQGQWIEYQDLAAIFGDATAQVAA